MCRNRKLNQKYKLFCNTTTNFPFTRLGLSVTTPGGSTGAPDGRHNSLEDINLDQFLKTSNYEDTVKQLDIYYGIGKKRRL